MITGSITERIHALMNLRHEEGQDLAEYALLLVFIAASTIVAVTMLGCRISMVFASLAATL